MLTKTNIFTLGLIIFSFNLFSQDVTEEKRKLKNEIAIDASPILGAVFREGGLPGLVYRRHFNNCSFRAKTNFTIDRSKQDRSSISYYNNGNSPGPSESRFTQFDFAVGLQKAKAISEKWKFYYGLDLFAGFTSHRSESKNQYQRSNSSDGTTDNGVTTQTHSINSTYGGVSPFLGFTWQIAERLGLSIEASVPIGYNKSTSVYSNFDFSTNNSRSYFSTDRNSSNNFRARIVPVSNLLISYHF
ncbi:MAG TPA: hypothetical protein VF691_09550 [Cytophagaceae bacterium]|jgi:hypothetical protein